MNRNRRVICALAGLLLAGAAYGRNVVTDWAAIVQPAVNTPPKAPVYQMVLRAMIQIAVYDAVVAIEGGYQPFAASISPASGANVRAAVATALGGPHGPEWILRKSRTSTRSMPTT